MRPLTLAAALAASSPAQAGELPVAWGTGLQQGAPTAWGVSAAVHQVIGPTWVVVPEVNAHLPVRHGPRFSGGFTLRMNADGLIVPSEDRNTWSLGVVEAAGWMIAHDPDGRFVHGAGLVLGGNPTNSTAFWRLSRDTGVYFGAFYEGYYRPTAGFHIAARVDLVGGAPRTDVATATLSLIPVPHPKVALHVGVQLGYTSLWLANAGVRVRPVEGLEIGVAVAVPLLSDLQPVAAGASWIRPSVEVRGSFGGLKEHPPDRKILR